MARSTLGVLAGLLLLCGVGGCVTPRTAPPPINDAAFADEARAQERFLIEQRLDERRRVSQIYHRISASNIEYCKTTKVSIGASFHTIDRFAKHLRPAAQSYGIGRTPSVAFVVGGGAAAAAGLAPGDLIKQSDGRRVFPGLAGLVEFEQAIVTRDPKKDLVLRVLRDGAERDIVIQPQRVCGYPVVLADNDEINAFADGRSIVLNRGLMRFVQSDDELALIIGHELAHNALGHIQAAAANQALGMAGGLAVDILIAATTGHASTTFMRMGGDLGAGAYSRSFETEADYVGMYFSRRGGFEIDGVELFWRRIAAESGGLSISQGGTHPPSAERFVVLAATRDEILAKEAANAPLAPNMKTPKPVMPNAASPSPPAAASMANAASPPPSRVAPDPPPPEAPTTPAP